MITLRDLEYLVALEECRHFGRAAAKCYASQPTLSTQIKKLEQELGAELIERGSRTVLFTPLGIEVATRARRVLSQTLDIESLAKQWASPLAGVVNLGGFPTLLPYLLPHVYRALHRALPRIEIRLVEEKTPTLLHLLNQGEIDAALVALPVDDERLKALKLFREEFVYAEPVDIDTETDSDKITLADVDTEKILLLDEGHCLRNQTLLFCQQQRHDSEFSATSLETLRYMIGAGLGTTILPALAVQGRRAPSEMLKLRKFKGEIPHRDIALVYRASSTRSELFAQIAEVLRQVNVEGVKSLA